MQNNFRSIATSRVLFIGVLAIAVYVAVSTIQVIARNWQLQQEIASLRGEIELLEAENERLAYDIAYYRTDQYLEQAARQSLNLKAPAENVTIVGETMPDLTAGTDSITGNSRPEKGNWQAWVDFLLGRQS